MNEVKKVIQRREYLEWLKAFKDKQIIKVVSGVRRCGKSTLLDLYENYLLENEVEKKQIIKINFESLEYIDLLDFMEAYKYIDERLLPDKKNYIFLDEVQNVNQFERFVDDLFIKENCDVYITGSNAYFLSGELATYLSGRYVQLKMQPLSFAEFFESEKSINFNADRNIIFQKYLQQGGFPYLEKYENSRMEIENYLEDLYNTVLVKDVLTRLKVTDINILDNIAKFMLHSIGNRISPQKISNALKSTGKKTDPKTVDRYLRGLTDSLILYEVDRFDVKGKKYLTDLKKYYTVDIGLRNRIVSGKESDLGHILENIVYLELVRRYKNVYVGSIDKDGEIDFVVKNEDAFEYYQVSVSIMDPAVLEREIKPLKNIEDNYPKYLLTMDPVILAADYDGIERKNIVDWLLGK
ncbi:MAG: ATP-binding protein [Lachnospiraceae bacterium]|jgi:predicted AAA+ superfamily ATPase|nr:ATP-binding protein [Lachnospiraceae bacterium]